MKEELPELTPLADAKNGDYVLERSSHGEGSVRYVARQVIACGSKTITTNFGRYSRTGGVSSSSSGGILKRSYQLCESADDLAAWQDQAKLGAQRKVDVAAQEAARIEARKLWLDDFYDAVRSSLLVGVPTNPTPQALGLELVDKGKRRELLEHLIWHASNWDVDTASPVDLIKDYQK